MQLVYAALLLAVTQAWAAPTEPPTSDVLAAGPSTALGPSASVEPPTDLLDVSITKKKKKGKKHEPYRYNNKVLLFRHGEKRSDSSIGLSVKGKKRAQCLRKVRTAPLHARCIQLARCTHARELLSPSRSSANRAGTTSA